MTFKLYGISLRPPNEYYLQQVAKIPQHIPKILSRRFGHLYYAHRTQICHGISIAFPLERHGPAA